MPAMIMLEQNKINVNEIVDPKNQETLLHLAGRFQFFNVMRTLIEKFNSFLLFDKPTKFRIRYYR